MEADERTLRLMEADCHNHPLSNAAAVTTRLQAALAAGPAVHQLRTQLQLLDTKGTGRVSFSDLQVGMPVGRCMGGQQRPLNPWLHMWLHGGAACAANVGSNRSAELLELLRWPSSRPP